MNLLKQNFYDYFDSSVSYFDNKKGLYVYCFFLPKTVNENDLKKSARYSKIIPKEALKEGSDLECQLKFRKKVKSKVEMLKDEQKERFNELDEESRKGKQKEKSISEVIEKVALWRKLYTGFEDEKGEVNHLELDKAAD